MTLFGSFHSHKAHVLRLRNIPVLTGFCTMALLFHTATKQSLYLTVFDHPMFKLPKWGNYHSSAFYYLITPRNPWQANSNSASQINSSLLIQPKLHCSVHKSPQCVYFCNIKIFICYFKDTFYFLIYVLWKHTVIVKISVSRFSRSTRFQHPSI